MVLPLILGALGSGLAATGVAGLGTLGVLGAGSLGAGLGSYMQTGDLEQGILTGLGSFAGGALLGPMLGGAGAGAGTAAGGATGTATGNALTGTGAALTNTGSNLANTGSTLAATGVNAGANAGSAAASLLPQRAKDTITAMTAGAAGPSGGIGSLAGSGTFGDATRAGMAYLKTPTGLGQLAGQTIAPLAFATPKTPKTKKDDEFDNSEAFPLPRTLSMPPADYRPGIDPEWNYGISTPQSATAIRRFGTRTFASGGGIGDMNDATISGGGIADVMAQQSENEKTIVSDAIKAIKGQIEDPRVPLAKFLATYGEKALRDLVETVEEGEMGGDEENGGKGMVRGPGDGMDDRVPARIADTGEDVLLADSEYIVPADVVSHLGNGSSSAGAKVLDGMLDRVRQARTGTDKQAPAIDPNRAIPA